MAACPSPVLALALVLFASVAGAQDTYSIFNSGHPVVATSGPDGGRSQFGFSIAFHTTDAGVHVLLVGAPRDNYSIPIGGISEPGVLYRCTTNTGSCEQMTVDTTPNLNTVSRREQKSYMRLGHSVASSGPNQPPIVCAPHFHFIWNCNQGIRGVDNGCFGNDNLDVWDPTGKCVFLPSNLGVDGTPRDYFPCVPPSNPVPLSRRPALMTARGDLFTLLEDAGLLPMRFNLIGSSLDSITDPANPAQSLIATGGPGFIFNEGQQYRATLRHSDRQISDSRQFGSFNPHHIDSFSSYAVAQGNLYGSSSLEMAVGVPRGQSIRNAADPSRADGSNRGEVRIFTRSLGFTDQDTPTGFTNIVFRIIGGQVAEHFGHTVVVEDTNADGFQEVFVGAPMYSQEAEAGNFDNGRVAVFRLHGESRSISARMIPFTSAVGVFTGTSRARFGSSIVSLGDLDYDGYNDIAVGAPYEGTGMVHIYMGSANGVASGDMPVQRIPVSDAAVRGMGFALASRTDTDNNGFADLAASAVQSGHAVIFRARPIIDVQMSVDAPTTLDHTVRTCNVDGELRACFNFSICATYTLPQPADLDATITYMLQSQPRLSFLASSTVTQASGSVSLTMHNTAVCTPHTVYIERNLRNPCVPVDLLLSSWNLVDVPSTANLLTPLLTRRVRQPITHTVTFVEQCATCNAALNTTINVTSAFELNSQHILSVTVDVINIGAVFACRPTITFSIASLGFLNASILTVQTNRSSRFDCMLTGHADASCQQASGLGVGMMSRFTVSARANAFGQGFTPERTLNLSVSASSLNEQARSPPTEASFLLSRAALLLLSVITQPTLVQIGGVGLDGQSFASHLTVINDGPGATPPHVIAVTLPTSLRSGRDFLTLFSLQSSLEGVACGTGAVDLALSNTDNGDPAPTSAMPRFPVRSLLGVEPQRLPCDTRICDQELLCTLPLMQAGDTANISWSWRISSTVIRQNNLSFPVNVEVRMRVVNVSDVAGFRLMNDLSLDSSTARAVVVLGDGTLTISDDEGINIWIIIGAILGAIALFAILVLILYKAGFFKRKRHTQVPQGEEKSVEAEADNQI